MTGWAWAAFALLGSFLFAALGDLVSEEIRGWLDLVPRAILRLAAARLTSELREAAYQDEWLPELLYVLRGAESRPITRLIRGTSFALGFVFSARRIGRYRAPAAQIATARPQQQPAELAQNADELGRPLRFTDLSNELPTSRSHLKITLEPATRWEIPPEQRTM
jgi:hypothetical protein